MEANSQIPWLESPVIYDVRAKPRNIASLTGTKDLQMVSPPVPSCQQSQSSIEVG